MQHSRQPQHGPLVGIAHLMFFETECDEDIHCHHEGPHHSDGHYSRFVGHLISMGENYFSSSKNALLQLGLTAIPAQNPPPTHECCFPRDGQGQFWDITLRNLSSTDTQGEQEAVAVNVQQMGGEYIKLNSEWVGTAMERQEWVMRNGITDKDVRIVFDPRRIKIEQEARDHALKYFPRIAQQIDALEGEWSTVLVVVGEMKLTGNVFGVLLTDTGEHEDIVEEAAIHDHEDVMEVAEEVTLEETSTHEEAMTEENDELDTESWTQDDDEENYEDYYEDEDEEDWSIQVSVTQKMEALTIHNNNDANVQDIQVDDVDTQDSDKYHADIPNR